jgi:N-acetyl-anhydromuramyl-L-alanine amidase AmpD
VTEFIPRILSYGSLVLPVGFKRAASGSYTIGRTHPRQIRLLVLHSAECAEVPTAAEALATWSNGSGHPQASWHFAVDSDSITQSVELEDVAWHADCVNGYSVGIEQAGRAAQSLAEWLDLYSAKVLDNVARLLAVLAEQYDLPLDYVTEHLDTAKGVTTHAAITRWARTKGGHTDPGEHYPIEMVLGRARALQMEAVS